MIHYSNRVICKLASIYRRQLFFMRLNHTTPIMFAVTSRGQLKGLLRSGSKGLIE